MRVDDVTTPTSVVNYSPPGHTGGVEPVGMVCVPGAGTAFPIGTTPVSCSASDAATPARTATCRFNVLVTPYIPPVPTISATKFMAFGDSLTLGENGCNNENVPCPFTRPAGHDYPTILASLLNARYAQQTMSMDNRGRGAETAADGASRLRDLLQVTVPQVLLLLEGVNDFAGDGTPASVAAALREDIRLAKAAGVKHVFLSNLPPEIADGSRAYGLRNGDLLTPTNALIRDVAAQEGVFLVDSYAALSVNLHENISSPTIPIPGTNDSGDGLHLTFMGNQVLANTFFQAIQEKLEAGASAMRTRR